MRRRRREPTYCIICGEYLDPEWYRKDSRYCGRSCANIRYYQDHKDLHRKIYAEKKRAWERSSTGKRAGTPIKEWLKYPKEFQ